MKLFSVNGIGSPALSTHNPRPYRRPTVGPGTRNNLTGPKPPLHQMRLAIAPPAVRRRPAPPGASHHMPAQRPSEARPKECPPLYFGSEHGLSDQEIPPISVRCEKSSAANGRYGSASEMLGSSISRPLRPPIADSRRTCRPVRVVP